MGAYRRPEGTGAVGLGWKTTQGDSGAPSDWMEIRMKGGDSAMWGDGIIYRFREYRTRSRSGGEGEVRRAPH